MMGSASRSGRNLKQQVFTLAAGNPVTFFLVGWTVLNLLQIAFTELTSDEGYYWFYAQHLQWGYYDHPPLIAAMIKAGSSLLPGELGVRFFNVVLSTGALQLFFSLLPAVEKNSRKTWIILLSAPLLHYLTFLLFPDGPLLFFSLLFLVFYKRFLHQENLLTTLLLGLALAGMAYAKYHGALVLLFTVLANPRLLKSGYFYLSLLVAGLLFAPHLWWQFANDFPTLKYHLSGRASGLSFRYVGEYLSQQVAAIGPGLIFIPFVCRATDLFERTLKYIIIGTFLFFLFSSFRTFIHFHWTSIALYPLLYFAVQYYQQAHTKKYFWWLIIPFAVLFLLARLLLLVPVIPNMHVGEDYYHGRKAWAKEIAEFAGNRPVFMPNNLREASLYRYYSGNMGVTLYTRTEKKSQYELWGYEDSLQGKEVVLVTKQPFHQSSLLPTSMRTVHYTVLPSFRSYYSGIDMEATSVRQTADSIYATINIRNHQRDSLFFSRGLNGESTTLVFLLEKDGRVSKADVLEHFKTTAHDVAPGGSTIRMTAFSTRDLPPGNYRLFFGIRAGLLPDAILSQGQEVRVR